MASAALAQQLYASSVGRHGVQGEKAEPSSKQQLTLGGLMCQEEQLSKVIWEPLKSSKQGSDTSATWERPLELIPNPEVIKKNW